MGATESDIALLVEVTARDGLSGLVRGLSEALSAGVALVDFRGNVLLSEPPRTLWDTATILRGGDQTGVSAYPVGEDRETGVTLIVAAGTTGKESLVYVATHLAGIQLTALRAAQEGRRELGAQVLEDVLETRLSEEDAILRLRALGVTASDPYRVIVGWAPRQGGRRLGDVLSIQSTAANQPDPFPRIRRGDYVVMVVPNSEVVDHLAHTLLDQIRHVDPEARVGVSSPYSGGLAIRAGYFEALTALREGPGVHRSQSVDVAALLILTSPAVRTIEGLDRVLGPLFDYDRRHGGHLVQTLSTFLGSERRAADTAAALFIHRNTLAYRLQQIEDLLGVNLAETATIVNLSLALRIHEYRMDPMSMGKTTEDTPRVDSVPAGGAETR